MPRFRATTAFRAPGMHAAQVRALVEQITSGVEDLELRRVRPLRGNTRTVVVQISVAVTATSLTNANLRVAALGLELAIEGMDYAGAPWIVMAIEP